MYLYALAGLITAATPRRIADRRTSGLGPRTAPKGLADLNDHYLRDIGFVRERSLRPRDHVIRM